MSERRAGGEWRSGCVEKVRTSHCQERGGSRLSLLPYVKLLLRLAKKCDRQSRGQSGGAFQRSGRELRLTGGSVMRQPSPP